MSTLNMSSSTAPRGSSAGAKVSRSDRFAVDGVRDSAASARSITARSVPRAGDASTRDRRLALL